MSLARAPVLRFALAWLCLASVSGAEILTVGPTGSGAQFTEIQAAIDAAQGNDVILVRPGTYQKIVVAKPLRILGDGTGSVVVSAHLEIGVTIRNIGPRQELVLSGVEVRATASAASILLEDNPGSVVLQDVLVAHSSGVGLRLEDCGRVVLLDGCILNSGIPGSTQRGAVFALDSSLWIANSEVSGRSDPDLVTPSSHGVELENSSLRVWRSRISGGSSVGAKPASLEPDAEGGSGIFARSSSVDLFGGSGSAVTGGAGSYVPLFDHDNPGGPGLELRQGSVGRIQADIPLAGGFDGLGQVQTEAIRTAGGSSFALEPRILPSLASSALQTPPGSSFDLLLEGNPGGYQVLYLSPRTGPTASFPGVQGQGLLDRQSRGGLFQITRQVLPASGLRAVPFLVPNDPSLVGTTLFFQSLEAFGSTTAIGNPSLVTITD